MVSSRHFSPERVAEMLKGVDVTAVEHALAQAEKAAQQVPLNAGAGAATSVANGIQELLSKFGLSHNSSYDTFYRVFGARESALIEQGKLAEKGSDVAKAISGELEKLSEARRTLLQHFFPNGLEHALPKPAPLQLTEAVEKTENGLINLLFKDKAGSVHPGKVTGVVVATVAMVAAVVGYFLLRDEKPNSKVDSVTDEALIASLTQRQV